MEAAAYLNVDNQVFLGSHRVSPAAAASGGGGGKRGKASAAAASAGKGAAPVPLVGVLLDVLGHARAFAERHEQQQQQQSQKGKGGVGEEDPLLAGGGAGQQQALAKRRAPDLLLACLRVLVNLTHHNRGAVDRLVEVRGSAWVV